MPLPTISTLPSAPSRSAAPSTFSTDADTFFNAFPTLVSQINDFSSQLPAVVNGIDYNGTSTTSVAIGTGSKTFTTQTGKNFQIGQFVIVASTASPANYMTGQVTAYTSGTGSITVNVSAVGGTGTFAAWTIALSASSTAYLPLSGGTLTGALAGTTATFGAALVGGTALTVGGSAAFITTVGATFSITPDPTSGANGVVLDAGFASGGYGPMRFRAGNLERMRIDASTGALGVGTTVPSGIFEARKDQAGASTFSYFRNGATGANTASGIQIITGTANSYVNIGVVDGTSRSVTNGPAITVAYDDSDTHTFRTNAGVSKLSLASDGGVTSPNVTSATGYKGLPQNAQSSAYTFALADMGKHVYATSTSYTLTIPTNATVAFPIGAAITIICEDATKTVAGAAGVTLVQGGSGTTGSRTLAIGAMATIVKVGTDRWYISGAGVS